MKNFISKSNESPLQCYLIINLFFLLLNVVIMNMMLMPIEKKLDDINCQFEEMRNDLAETRIIQMELENALGQYEDAINTLYQYNQESNEIIYDLMVLNDQYQVREELYNRYEYALFDNYGNRTDITYEQLENLRELVEESSLKDEDLILSIIMTESHGIETASNTSSSAKGYAQFLDSTSKFVYTNLLGKDDWTADVVLNGDVCIEMMVAYFDYLYEKNNGDVYDMLRSYRGKQDISSYVVELDRYLSNVDKTVYDIYCAQNNNN